MKTIRLKMLKGLAIVPVCALLCLSSCKTSSQVSVHHTTIYYNAAGDVLSYRDSVIWTEDCGPSEFVPFVLTKKPLVKAWSR